MARNGYDFYMDKCLLPVPPSKLTTKINNANKTVTLINEGEINILKQAKLTDIEFECEIPQVKQPYAVYPSGFKTAGYFLDYFEELKTGGKPFQFIVCRRTPNGKKFFNTNMKVTLENYKITEEAKQGFDLKIKISLKQWRDYGTKTVSITGSGTNTKVSVESKRETTNSPTPSSSLSYTVEKGDCLWTIAKKFYGDGNKSEIIYNANKNIIGDNPDRLYTGQELTIPPV